ncbi:MAG: hypothetical protein AMXMBFR53_10230 [Gemmatimonadota bacterium]
MAGQSAAGSDRLRRAVDALGDSARIRLLAPGVMVDDGLFLGLRSDSLLVADADARFRVGLGEVEGLSVQGSRWLEIGLQSGAVGLVAGAAAGYFLGYFHCGDEVRECGSHARGVGLRWGLVFGSAGVLGGGAVGSRMRRWERVFP